MEKEMTVARYIASRIREVGKTQAEIAREVGFETPNMVSMIKRGHTKVPLAKVTAMARALEADPKRFVHMCLAEYQPEIWQVLAPFLESALTEHELKILKAFRQRVGAPYVVPLTEESQDLFHRFLESLRVPSTIH